MADPVLIPVVKGSWVPVATNVTTGQLWRIIKTASYLMTYRMAGNPVPTLETEGVPIFVNGEISAPISAVAAIDVYLWARGVDGKIRADL